MEIEVTHDDLVTALTAPLPGTPDTTIVRSLLATIDQQASCARVREVCAKDPALAHLCAWSDAQLLARAGLLLAGGAHPLVAYVVESFRACGGVSPGGVNSPQLAERLKELLGTLDCDAANAHTSCKALLGSMACWQPIIEIVIHS